MGLNYFGARYYDPVIGYWISLDPAEEFFNPYRYTTNPIGYVDPTGMAEVFVGFEGELAGGEGGLAGDLGVTFDLSNIEQSGLYGSMNHRDVGSMAVSGGAANIGLEVGFTIRDKEGTSTQWDLNWGPYSVTFTRDEKGFNGISASYGFGAGAVESVSETHIRTFRSIYNQLVIEPLQGLFNYYTP